MSIGFIILRHVNSEQTNLYWQTCYDCIRKFYLDNKIIIIDDNSDYTFITQKECVNTELVQSEYIGRAELLPYYYYSKNKWFDTAFIIHDTIFLNKYIDFNVDKFMFIFHFEHNWDLPDDEKALIQLLDNNVELLDFYEQKHLWYGCFGAMTIITYEYVNCINNRYNFSKLLNGITTRHHRMCFERVIACMLQYNNPKRGGLFGPIHHYCEWGLTFDKYLHNKQQYQLPVIKIWAGR